MWALRLVNVSDPETLPPRALVLPGCCVKVAVPDPLALLNSPVPPVTVNVPVNVWGTFTPVGPTSHTVPVSLFAIVPSPRRVRVVWPVAGAQKPPCPLALACIHSIVNVEVKVPPATPVSVPLDVSVQPAAVTGPPADPAPVPLPAALPRTL